ncbi:hypothetical protein RMR10_012000 [Agrobacterium rosae]|uniref:hypothetical protein n=1 Tax=Agrobacterium rosae TaxID=1972867 RepID=UPI002A0EAB84|nr:hypothetical protein [Agrobacterium rosae]MDX8313350.1 hypothetical protein [Agrobacterium rosae]
MINVVVMPAQRRDDVASTRLAADNIQDWADHILDLALKAEKGVRSARKVETATFRFGKFYGRVKLNRSAIRMLVDRLADDPSLPTDKHRLAVAMVNCFDRVDRLMAGSMPWSCLPHPHNFIAVASKTAENIAEEMGVAILQCKKLKGDL